MPPGIELGTSRAEDLSQTPDGAFLVPRAHIVVLALVLARARGSNPGPPVLPGAHSLKYNFYQNLGNKSACPS